MLREFKTFLLRGSVLELAVAVILPIKARRCPLCTSDLTKG